MKGIYKQNGVSLSIQTTIPVSGSQYEKVSKSFTNSETAELVKMGSSDKVNLFFLEDYMDSSYLGNSAGIPGSQGVQGGHNGVLINLNAHETNGVLDDQLLGETMGHEMGHFLGLYHPTESAGTLYDPLSDTPQCGSANDSDSSGKVSAEECESYGGGNVMFWTSYSTSSRNAGKKQERLCPNQVKVIRYSPLAQ